MIVHAKGGNGVTRLYTKPIFQYESDVYLSIEGITVTLPFVVDLSNSEERGNAIKHIVKQVPFQIPETYTRNGDYIFAWVHANEETVLVVIPVIQRAIPVETSGSGDEPYYDYHEDDENLVFEGTYDEENENFIMP